MKTIPFIAALIIFAFGSCNQKPSNTGTIVQDEEVVDSDDSAEENPLCNDVKDMAVAMPKFDDYRGYELHETFCLANRAFGYNFRAKDGTPKEFTIMLYDTRTDYKDMYTHFVAGYKEAQESKAPDILRVSKLKGDKGYVVAFNDAEVVGGTYDRLIKNTYYLHLLISDDKTASSPDGIEAFVEDFVSKIDDSKLK